MDSQRRVGRFAGEEGAAIVEMALVGVLLVLLLFGIISFGYLMGFRQNMVQAAAEGARRGAVAKPGSEAGNEALGGASDAVHAFGQDCGVGGMNCSVSVDRCENNITVQCVTVALDYDYQDFPLLPDVPIVGALLPKHITTQSVAEINP
ncbi:MAG TPA: TadE/TadG family type IV pilus assembly protein [Acidimicrobiales bacterium]